MWREDMIAKILAVLVVVAGLIFVPQCQQDTSGNSVPSDIVQLLLEQQRQVEARAQAAIAGDDSRYVGIALAIIIGVLILVPFGWLFATRYLARDKAIDDENRIAVQLLIRRLTAGRDEGINRSAPDNDRTVTQR